MSCCLLQKSEETVACIPNKNKTLALHHYHHRSPYVDLPPSLTVDLPPPHIATATAARSPRLASHHFNIEPESRLPVLPRSVSWPILNSLVSSPDDSLEWKGACFYKNRAWMEFHNKSRIEFGGGTLHVKPESRLPVLPRSVSWPILNSLVSSPDDSLEWKGACFYKNRAWMEFHNKSRIEFGGGTLHVKGQDILPWNEWLFTKDDSSAHIALLPSHPDLQAKFNETAAWEYALSMSSQPFDLEWLSHFVEDSFSEYSLAGKLPDKTTGNRSEPLEIAVLAKSCFTTPVQTKARSKRLRTGSRVWSLGSPSLTETTSSSSSSSSFYDLHQDVFTDCKYYCYPSNYIINEIREPV
ncbi:hypothetical protein TEA_012362 [Camellia sinensis var. sinensis]|uniref:Uncharacterized protein n=1 Tax=Camellia sinensis var. sinensis TaxID=542762 RepID=A0A4V3WKM9_CAMSN|nr:hypothetical protein TEA_012362 [Camellia sinensis var. sinensis]